MIYVLYLYHHTSIYICSLGVYICMCVYIICITCRTGVIIFPRMPSLLIAWGTLWESVLCREGCLFSIQSIRSISSDSDLVLCSKGVRNQLSKHSKKVSKLSHCAFFFFSFIVWPFQTVIKIDLFPKRKLQVTYVIWKKQHCLCKSIWTGYDD